MPSNSMILHLRYILMFEMMLMSSLKAGVKYPDSGPGDKTLSYGTPELGFFGEVPESQLLSIAELRDQLSFYNGVDSGNNTRAWLKLYINNKVLFLPKSLVTTEVSWSELYEAGLIHGVDGVGQFTTANPTNQYRIVVAPDKRLLKVRTIQTNTVQPILSASWNSAATADSEWGKIIGALMVDIGSLPYTGPRFNKYRAVDNVLAQSTWVIGQNSHTTAGSTLSVMNTGGTVNTVTTPRGWLPVLELLPTDTKLVFPMSNIAAATDTFVAPVTMDPLGYYNPVLPYRGVQSATLSQRQVVMADLETTDSVYTIERAKIKATMNPATWVHTSVSYEA